MVWDIYGVQPYVDALVTLNKPLWLGWWSGFFFGLLRRSLGRATTR